MMLARQYFTTTGWMMWNWLVTALASDATLVLYDGNPTGPGGDDPSTLFRLGQDLSFTHFGTSAKFIDSINKSGWTPISDGGKRVQKLAPSSRFDLVSSLSSHAKSLTVFGAQLWRSHRCGVFSLQAQFSRPSRSTGFTHTGSTTCISHPSRAARIS